MFNKFYTKQEIVNKYKNNSPINTICMLLKSVNEVKLLSTEKSKYIFTESEEGIENG